MLHVLASSGGSSVVGPDAWSSVMSALTAQISVSTIIGVLATLVTAGIGLVFMWSTQGFAGPHGGIPQREDVSVVMG